MFTQLSSSVKKQKSLLLSSITVIRIGVLNEQTKSKNYNMATFELTVQKIDQSAL